MRAMHMAAKEEKETHQASALLADSKERHCDPRSCADVECLSLRVKDCYKVPLFLGNDSNFVASTEVNIIDGFVTNRS